MTKVCLILHNIRSGQNVGSIFRSADAVGVKEIYLTGYTPRPLDRFGAPDPQVAKAALGAENYVPWQGLMRLSPLLARLRKQDYQIIALEQSSRAVDYKKVKLRRPTAIIFGNEIRGIPQSILKQCDLIAEIPMRGKKESINVAVAAAVALFRWLDLGN
ncbi:MAG: TrmH family RNA methyltransferase [archaeon]